jgi:low affinity Fe/Cu permease
MRMFIKNRFELWAEWFSNNLGHPYAFLMAVVIVLTWAICGPVFNFSDTWQLVINTGTTIGTFLMVFLLQNTGNRGIKEMEQRIESLENHNHQLLMEMRNISNKFSDRSREDKQ